MLHDIYTRGFYDHFITDNGRSAKDLQWVIGLFLPQALKDMAGYPVHQREILS